MNGLMLVTLLWQGQCPPGTVCPLVKGQTIVAQSPTPDVLRWEAYPDRPGEAFLFRGKKLLGLWNEPTQKFHAMQANGDWAGASPPPIPAPNHPKEPEFYFGVDPFKSAEDGRAHLNGVEVTLPEAAAILESGCDGCLEDDCTRPHVTIIARNAKARAKALADLKSPELEGLRKSSRVQVYDLSRKVDAIIVGSKKYNTAAEWEEDAYTVVFQSPAADGVGQVEAGRYPVVNAARLVDVLKRFDLRTRGVRNGFWDFASNWFPLINPIEWVSAFLKSAFYIVAVILIVWITR